MKANTERIENLAPATIGAERPPPSTKGGYAVALALLALLTLLIVANM